MRFIDDNLLPLWLAVALIAAASCWFGLPAPTPGKLAPPVNDAWLMPTMPETQTKKSVDAITVRNLWGIVPANLPLPPVWAIQGIARSGADRFILLAFEGKPAEILKVGDLLPDGTKIVQIENDRFFVLNAEKKKVAFGIYKNESPK